MNKKALTLLELLVVIVIIGLLAGILFPLLGRTIEAGRRAQCINNLRQHGIAWHLYLNDHNELFPQWGLVPSQGGVNTPYDFGGKKGETGGPSYGAEYRVLNTYLDIYDESSPNINVLHCPDDATAWGIPPATTFNKYGNSYYINDVMIPYGAGGNYRPRPLSTVTSSHSKVAMEVCYWMNYPGHGIKDQEGGRTPVFVLFLDWHVAGPFLYDQDFELHPPEPDKDVLFDANGTPGPD